MKSRIEKVASVLALILMTGFCIIVSLKSEPKRENDIIILYTNDVHTYIDGDISYDTIAGLKQLLQSVVKSLVLLPGALGRTFQPAAGCAVSAAFCPLK